MLLCGMFYDNFPEYFGFRAGEKGTHTSRTIMLDDLSSLFEQMPPDANRDLYLDSIIKDNSLHKNTYATRKHSAQRLSELYALDPAAVLFRTLRKFWLSDSTGRPLLALLCALARDPLLRITAEPVLALHVGEELSRRKMTEYMNEALKDRLNESIIDKVIRNASSSWTQSGHLDGRVRKHRRLAKATPQSTAYALFLGYLQGIRGGRLFNTSWTKVLDCTLDELRFHAMEARKFNYIDLKIAGDVIEIGFSELLTPQETREVRVTC